jgi:Primase C terminal 2 (PriCT-2)/RepB DNA-primase from phage plasmid
MSFDRTAVENHVALLHQLAGNCGTGVLVLVPIWENRNVCAQKFAVGQTKQMIDAIMAFDGTWGVNLYSSYATMRANLAPGKKGAERDVEYVFAAVADIDTDPGKAEQREIGVEPSYVVESSPGNFQRVYIFEKPLPAVEAKPVLIAFHAAIGGDTAQRDCSHVWRIPGTSNWPTKSKIARGRPEDPAPVTVAQACNGHRVDPAVLLALAPIERPKAARKAKAKKQTKQDLPTFESTKDNAELLRSALPLIPADDRDIWIKILAALKTLEPTWGQRARTIADWWSRKSSKYNQAEQDKAWESLSADRAAGVTIATIFHLARENGWADLRPAARAASEEDALALRFAERHEARVRYVELWGKWIFYEVAVWKPESTGAAFDLSRKLTRGKD